MLEALRSLWSQVDALRTQLTGLIAEAEARARGPVGDDEPPARVRRIV